MSNEKTFLIKKHRFGKDEIVASFNGKVLSVSDLERDLKQRNLTPFEFMVLTHLKANERGLHREELRVKVILSNLDDPAEESWDKFEDALPSLEKKGFLMFEKNGRVLITERGKNAIATHFTGFS